MGLLSRIKNKILPPRAEPPKPRAPAPPADKPKGGDPNKPWYLDGQNDGWDDTNPDKEK